MSDGIHKTQRRSLGRAFAIALALVALVVAGCGGDDDSGGSGGSGDGGGSGSASAEELSGKSIGYIDVFATAPIEVRFYNAFETAAEHVGWTVQLQDTQAQQSRAVSAGRNFINQGVDAIVTSSVPAEWMRPVNAQADAQDVPMIELITEASPGVFEGQVLEPAEPFSRALAEQVIEDNPDGAQVGIIYEGGVQAEVQRLEVLQEVLGGAEGIEVVATHDQPQVDQPGATKATIDMLNGNPGIDVIVAVASPHPQYILAGLRQAGANDVEVYSYYADSVNAPLLQDNDQFVMVTDSDIAKASFIAVDELLKHFSGNEITEKQFVDVEPVLVAGEDVTPALAEDEGPVPYEEIAQPFYQQWNEEYGIPVDGM